jgi:hypothetical protein
MTELTEGEWLTRTSALKLAIAAADAVLLPAGFSRVGRSRVWRQETAELLHIIQLQKHGDGYVVQWSTVCPEAVPVLWAAPVDPTSVQAGMITGRPNDVDPQVRGGFFTLGSRVRADRANSVATKLAAALEPVAETLAPLAKRADLRALLLASGEAASERVFMLPSSRSLQLLSAAILAVLDASPDGPELMARAGQAGLRGDDDRLLRLRKLAAAGR